MNFDIKVNRMRAPAAVFLLGVAGARAEDSAWVCIILKTAALEG